METLDTPKHVVSEKYLLSWGEGVSCPQILKETESLESSHAFWGS